MGQRQLAGLSESLSKDLKKAMKAAEVRLEVQFQEGEVAIADIKAKMGKLSDLIAERPVASQAEQPHDVHNKVEVLMEKIEEQNTMQNQNLQDLGELVLGEIADLRNQVHLFTSPA